MKILFCLNSIVNSYFDVDYFDYLIDYIYFVRNFVIFFFWRSTSVTYMVIGFLNNSNYLEVVHVW